MFHDPFVPTRGYYIWMRIRGLFARLVRKLSRKQPKPPIVW